MSSIAWDPAALTLIGQEARRPADLRLPGRALKLLARKGADRRGVWDVVEAARVGGARSLGDYAQAQAARVPIPKGENRWSRPSVARVLRYCKPTEE